jgi:hypothetical protein
MNKKQQYKLDALDRVESYVTVNGVALGALATSEAAVQVKAAIAAYRAQVTDQDVATLAMMGQVARERSLTVELRTQFMKPISTFARTRFKGVPDLAALTKSGAQLTGKGLVQAARGMATAAAPHLAELVKGGFPSDVLTQLGGTADALQTAIADRATAKVARVGAVGGQKQQLAAGLDAVRMLDAVISRQFAGNATLLSSWRVAKRVTQKPGVSGVSNSSTAPTGAAPMSPASPGTPVVTTPVNTVATTVVHSQAG